jgi:hypothetical protein
MLVVAAGSLVAAEPKPATGEAGMSFHRVYAPADRIDEWPRGTVRYVPMDREAFERTVAEIAAEAKAPANQDTQVERAVYTARLDDAGGLRGSVELSISHKAEQSVLLPLGKCDLTLTAAAWTHAPTQAVLGVGRDGGMHVLVERSGTLRVDFVLRGITEAGRTAFRAKAPSGVVTRWLLDGPLGATPTAEGGHVEAVPTTADAGTSEEAADDAAPDTAVGETRRVWQIELGSRNQLDLSIQSANAASDRLVATMQSTDYTIAANGVSLLTKYAFTALHEIPSRIVIQVDAEATLLDAEIDGKPAKVVGHRRASGGEQSVTLELPSLPAMTPSIDRSLTIRAFVPSQLGRRWRLPRIVAEDIPWQDAEARITAQAPLRIAQLWPTNAQLSSAATPHTATLSYLAADASVEAVVEWEPREIRGTSALLLEVGSEARGQAVLAADFPDAARTTLAAQIDAHWVVEGVTASFSEAIADWHIAADPQGRETLVVECRPGVDKHVRIVAAVRRRESPEQRPINAAELLAIDWSHSCTIARSVVSIGASRTYQISTTGGHRLSLVTESDAASPLLAEHAGQLKFDLESAGPGLSIAARRAATPFRGDIEVESFIAADTIRDTFRVRCTPQSEGLAQVVVRVSPPVDGPISWTYAANASEVLTARRLSDNELRAFLMEPGSEAWRITLVQSRSTPFEVVGRRTRAFAKSAPVALAALQNAASQTGVLTIRTSVEQRVAIENRRLTAIPPREDSLSEVSDVLAVYRFVPPRDAAVAETAIVSRVDRPSDAGAVAYACRQMVRLHPDGKTAWSVTYDVESFGQSEVELSLPGTATRHDIAIDGRIATSGERPSAAIRLALPKNRRFVRIVASFETSEAGLAIYKRRSFESPKINVPVLQRQWTMMLPEEFDTTSVGLAGRRPISLSERLFGPVGRRGDEPALNPIPWIVVRGTGMDETSGRVAVEEILDSLGEARKSAAATPAARQTWGDLLGQIDKERFYVDAESLDRAGITPWTAIPDAAKGTGRAVVTRLLLESQLGIVTDGRRTLLTTAVAAASARDARALLLGMPSDLRHTTWFSANGVNITNLISARRWSQGATSSLPWATVDGETAWPGWRRIELTEGGEALTLDIVNLESIRTAAWLVFLVSAALAWRFFRRGAAVWFVMAATAIAALLMGEAHYHFLPLLWAIWWGLCIGSLVAMLPRKGRREHRATSANSALSWPWKRAGAMTAFLFVALWVVRSWAQEVPPAAVGKEDAATNATIHQVFFPVDDDRKPVGTRVYVPEPLFARLERHNLDRQRGPRGAVLVAATHRVQLDWGGDGASLEPRSATALVDIVTFDDEAEVRLPVGMQSIEEEDRGDESKRETPFIRVDGALLEPSEFEIDGNTAIFQIAKAGTHRVEIPLRRSPSDGRDRVGLEFEPIAAGLTTVEISVPENSPEIEIAKVGDSVVLARGRGMLASPIAAAKSYAVRWAKGPLRAVEGRIESAERLRLDVRPTTVTLTAEVILSGTTSLPEELRIAADARLFPTSALVDGQRTTWRRTGAEDGQLSFRIPATAARETKLEMTFLLRETAGIGVLRLPRWEPAVAEVRRRWLAVNIDETLEHEISVGPEIVPMAVGDFVQDESEDVLPQYAYRLPAGAINWSLTTRRKPSRVRVDQLQTILGKPNGAMVILDADISVSSGDVYDFVFRCDDRFRIDRVTSVGNGGAGIAYWTQSADGVVQVFLKERATAQQRLRLEGHIEATEAGMFSVRDVVLDGAERTQARVKLYRMPLVRLSVDMVTGYTDVQSSTEVAAASANSALGDTNRLSIPRPARLLRELVSSGDAAPAISLRLEKNAPKIDATSVVTVEEISADSWFVRGEFRGTVADGVLDEIVVDLPGDWIGVPVVEPAMPTSAETTSEGGLRVTVRPVLPLRRAFAVSVVGRVRAPANRAVPRWKLLEAEVQREFCLLPTLWDGRILGWDLAEMRRDKLAAEFRSPVREGARYDTYELVGDRALATLQAEVPRVRALEAYFEVIAAPLDAESYSVAATYDLIPSGVGECRIKMPPGSRLLAAILDDRRQTPHEAGKDEWRVDLQSDSLPQRLTILAIVPTEKGSGGSHLWTAPQLLDAQIRQTTWSVPANHLPAGFAGRAAPGDAARNMAATREERLAKLWAAAAASSSEQKATVVRRWQRRLAAAIPAAGDPARVANANYVIAANSNLLPAANVATLVQQYGAALLGRFGDDLVFELPEAQAQRFADQLSRATGAGGWATVLAMPPKTCESAELLRQSGGRVGFLDVATSTGAWTFETTSKFPQTSSWRRWLLALGIAALSLAFSRSAVRRRALQEIGQRPYAALAAVGVAWWLWLSPGWIGWVLIAFALGFAWRVAWSLPRVDARGRPFRGMS